jgi:hypothetical protein
MIVIERKISELELSLAVCLYEPAVMRNGIPNLRGGALDGRP